MEEENKKNLTQQVDELIHHIEEFATRKIISRTSLLEVEKLVLSLKDQFLHQENEKEVNIKW